LGGGKKDGPNEDLDPSPISHSMREKGESLLAFGGVESVGNSTRELDRGGGEIHSLWRDASSPLPKSPQQMKSTFFQSSKKGGKKKGVPHLGGEKMISGKSTKPRAGGKELGRLLEREGERTERKTGVAITKDSNQLGGGEMVPGNKERRSLALPNRGDFSPVFCNHKQNNTKKEEEFHQRKHKNS